MQVFSNILFKSYIRTQRVSSKIGTTENLGDYLQDWFTQGTGGPVDVIGSSFGVLENAEDGVVQVYTELGIEPPVYDNDPMFIPVQSFIHGGNEVEQYYFHPDHLGSTSYITNLLGEVSQHMEYFAFGETFVEEHRSSNNSPYKYNGKELDEETGWYYYGARYYDPRVSVWLSVDPLAEVTFEPYSYVGNNPIMFTDPTGMAKDDIVFMGEGGAEIHRIKDDNVNKTFVVDINASSVAIEGFSKDGAQGWIEAKMPGTIPRKYDYNGGSASTTGDRYQQYDYLIAAETSYFNQYKNSGVVPTLDGKMMSDAGSKVPDLDPNIVKAIAMIETNVGNIAKRGLNDGSQDIMQANVFYSAISHDWNSEKTQFGLTKGGGATPAESVRAGIGLLFLKGLRDPGNIYGSQVNKWFGGADWGNAIRDYNGVSKIKPHYNLPGKVVYRNFVLQMAKEAR